MLMNLTFQIWKRRLNRPVLATITHTASEQGRGDWNPGPAAHSCSIHHLAPLCLHFRLCGALPLEGCTYRRKARHMYFRRIPEAAASADADSSIPLLALLPAPQLHETVQHLS